MNASLAGVVAGVALDCLGAVTNTSALSAAAAPVGLAGATAAGVVQAWFLSKDEKDGKAS
jgi:hypothetical protein